MTIVRFDAGPWSRATGWQGILDRALRATLPAANPDLEPAYEHVTYWWLEIDEQGLVTREIGFSPAGRAVAAAPLGKNLGIFTDLDGAPAPLGAAVEVADFERVWAEVQDRFSPGQPGSGLL
jgi:hypothetical protein